ncbi:hypothetical protein BEN47_15235 [Hymenobacter lapidarius]|uniref:Uncharacterized protein n=1 Tax=Hymenobacter lapidarius TaxID=1908237 RepID=A0A1G1T353_9BACT|nr:hypothetical protein [Hymenobacter lapidarius]OGX85308.1 hypothetical protein BEN47_15235 [Hymenobacter lapidarius]
MHIWPDITEQFYSPFGPAEVRKRLQWHTLPPDSWHEVIDHSPRWFFKGRVGDHTFDLRHFNMVGRVTVPLITGEVAELNSPEGSRLVVRQRMHWAMGVFYGFWSLLVGAFGSGMGLVWYLGGGNEWPILFFSLLLLLGSLTPITSFWRAVGKNRVFLQKLLQLENQQP